MDLVSNVAPWNVKTSYQTSHHGTWRPRIERCSMERENQMEVQRVMRELTTHKVHVAGEEEAEGQDKRDRPAALTPQ